LVLAMPAGAWASSSVPDWVREAAKTQLPHYPPSTRAVVLLDETTYTVGTNGQAVQHVRRVIKILRPQGREDAVPFVFYDKDSKVTMMHVWAIGADGHEFVVKDNEISDIGIPGGGGDLYSDDRVRMMATPPGSDPGGVVAVEYEKKERPYLAETTWFFQDDLPRVRQSFTLTMPEGFTHTTTWAHHAPDPGIDLEHRNWRWEANDVHAVDLQDVTLAPATMALAARMTLHYAGPGLKEPQEGSWKGIGQWYDTLAHDRLQPSPEIAAKAAELSAGKKDFYDKVEPVAEFAQQKVRYVEIKLGVGGYQPHSAADTFRSKYGDCKDKATLLSAMLASIGVHSALVIVDTERGVIDAEAPSIVGNHAILAIEIPAGYTSPKLRSVVTAKTGKRYLIFDPTWDKTPFGQLESNLQGSYGILMEGDQSQVIALPVLSPELNRMQRAAKFELSDKGELKGSVTDTRFGDLAERRRMVFTQDDAKDQQKFLDRTLREDFTSVRVTDIAVENAASLNKDLKTSFALDASSFATTMGPLMMVRPRVFGSYAPEVDRKSRDVPADLQETMKGNDDFEIVLPAGYKVDELPDPVHVDVGFASYDSKTEVTGRTLHYSRTYTVREVVVPAAHYGDLRKLARAIAADEQNRAVLKREP
jgi:hypothetical protein